MSTRPDAATLSRALAAFIIAGACALSGCSSTDPQQIVDAADTIIENAVDIQTDGPDQAEPSNPSGALTGGAAAGTTPMGGQVVSETPATATLDQPAPDFTLATIDADGNRGELTLSDLRGKVVVITFWAPWCPFCVQDLPTWQTIADEYGDDLVVLGIDTGDPETTVARFIKLNEGLSLTWGIADTDILNAYPSRGIPYDLIIDREGVVRFMVEGSYQDRMYDVMTDVINQLV